MGLKIQSLPPVLVVSALLFFSASADAVESLWATTVQGGGEIVVATPGYDFDTGLADRLLGRSYNYLIIDIRNEMGSQPIRFNPSVDKVILNMSDGELFENLDVSERANRASLRLWGNYAAEVRLRFGDMKLMPGTRAHGILVYPADIDLSQILHINLRLHVETENGVFIINHELEPLDIEPEPPPPPEMLLTVSFHSSSESSRALKREAARRTLPFSRV